MRINNISGNNQQSFTHLHLDNENKTSKEKKVHLASIAGSALGVGIAYAFHAKKQGFSLNPKRILRTPVKDWSLIKLFDKKNPDRKLIKLHEKEILTMAGSSVAGGFIGGSITDDKKNIKAKGREALNQILGNVLIPVGFVSGASKIYTKYKPQILSYVPQIKSNGKFIKHFNKALKYIPSSIMTLAALGAGIITGNKVSNFINEKLYHKEVDRKIKGTDFAPHVDDLSMAVSLMAKQSKFSSAIANTVPVFLCFPGIETGTAKEK